MKHKCYKCGTEYEGNFCPECGEKWQKEKTCPQCGAILDGSAKFCNICGYSFAPAPVPAPSARQQRTLTKNTGKLYSLVSLLPAALFALLSVLMMLFFLAPVAVMPGGEILGQTIPSESYGNVYEISNFEGTSLTGSLTVLIIFAVCALVLTAALAVAALFSKLRYKRVALFGKPIFLRSFLTGLGYVLFFVLFIVSCVLLGQISNEDDGFGIFTAGAAPILILVFTLIGCLIAAVCTFAVRYLHATYPALVKAQEEKIASVKPTAFETWLKGHKKATALVSAVLVVAIIVSIVVPVAVANRHNGVYYAYNGETEEYDTTRYYKLSGGTWEDEEGNKGEIVFDGENVTLTFDLSGGMDKTGSSNIEIEGTIVGDVLKIDGTVYAKEGHEHEMSFEILEEATCTETGIGIDVCRCGHRAVDTETIEALGHDFQEENCIRCGIPRPSDGLKIVRNGDHCYVKDIGYCTDTNIVIPDLWDGYPVTAISSRAFVGERIGYYTEVDKGEVCEKMKTVFIPSSITTIGEDAFRDCHSLENVIFGENSELTSIGEGAFYHCVSLTDIVIPNGVKQIGGWAFCDTGLTAVNIPENLISIGERVFYACPKLESVNWNAINLQSSGILEGVGNIKSISFGEHVESLPADIINTPGGNNLEKIIVHPDNPIFKSDNNCLLNLETAKLVLGCKNSIIPEGVTEIGDYAFQGCGSLKNITIPGSVTSIGRMAFYGCDSLNTVYYKGTPEKWENILKGYYSDITNAILYYFSADPPTEAQWQASANWWHYGKDNEIVIWNEN